MSKQLKTLNVNLAFNADTRDAASQIKNLQKELNNLASGANLNNIGVSQITPEIQKAMVAAGELQAKLQQATNVNTGKLDLSKFSESLKKSGKDLKEYAIQLNALGPAGRQAFTNLAQSIIQAEAPLIRCNKRLKEFGTTIANTARWQVSSSILHSFMGTLQSAVGYAEDLNESLNNIRIVTGQNIDQMSKFAKEANKAARALSTTTTEYTDASLIYYQQGLSDEEVKKRTDITIKMANVTRDSAEDVSNQLTAIWNNFADGSQSLEYYADVLTKLGAATASSTDEIAGGLEKFAAVAQTIGLSYEYAASALATITSNTRESEEVVGTALKTIFARIQGLNLGETLEDGTTLNKYSEALQKVGVSIFDQNNQIKEMDTILNELAKKWKNIGKNEQIALAETVAGVRQYNQLVALLDNWDTGNPNDTDSMVANLKTAKNAQGELQNQADIYAESWEAARDRVTAAAEELYNKILKDEFFIDFLNGIEKSIDGVSSLIDAMGGLEGVLLTIGTLTTRIFRQEMVQSLHNLAYNIKQLTPKGREQWDKDKQDAIEGLKEMRSTSQGSQGVAEDKVFEYEIDMQKKLFEASKVLNEEELKQLQTQIEISRVINERYVAAAKLADKTKEEAENVEAINRAYARAATRESQRKQGRLLAGMDLIKEANQKEGSYFAKIIGEANTLAESEVRKKHNFSGEIDISPYQEEIEIEITKQIDKAIENLARDGILDKENKNVKNTKRSIKNIIKTNIKDSIKDEDVAKAIQKDQNTAKKIGNVVARGEVLDETIINYSKEDLDSEENKDFIIKQLRKQLNDLTSSIQEIGTDGEKSFKNLNKKIEELEKNLGKVEKGSKNLKQVLYDFGDDESGKNKFGLISDNIGSEMIAEINDVAENNGYQNYDDAIKSSFEAGKKQTKANLNLENLKEDAENYNKKLSESLDKASISLNDWATKLQQGTQIIMELGMAINAIQNAFDTFNNPDATAWDKLSVSIGTVLSILPLATSAMNAYSTAIVANKKAILAADGAMNFFSASVLKFLTNPYVLGIVALTSAFIALDQIINEEEKDFKRLEKTTDNLNTTFSNIKSEVEGIDDALNGLNSKIKTIDDLTFGTSEWASAIREVNEETRKLIDEYELPETLEDGKRAWYRDDRGVIQLTDEGQKEIKKQGQERLKNAQNANLVANYLTDSQDIEKQKEDLRNKWNKNNSKSDDDSYVYHDAYVSYDSINKIIELLNSGKIQESDLVNAGVLIEQGIEAAQAQLISSNDSLQTSIFDLTIATKQNTEKYQSQIADELLGDENFAKFIYGSYNESTKQVEGGLDKEYQTGALDYTSGYVLNRANFLATQISDKETFEKQDEYAKAAGYTKTESKFGNSYVDKDGNKIKSKDLEKYTKEWIAHNKALEESKKLQEDYNKLVQKSKVVWDSAKELLETSENGQSSIWVTLKEDLQAYKDEAGSFDGFTIPDNTKSELAKFFQLDAEDAENLITPEFIYEHQAQIQEALQGDSQAYEDVHYELAIDAMINDEGLSEEAKMVISTIQPALADLEIGVDLEDEKALKAMQFLLDQSYMTSAKMKEIFSKIGVAIEITEFEGEFIISGTREGSILEKVENPNGNGNGNGTVGTKPKSKKDLKSIDDEIDRYHEIKEVLEDLDRSYNNISKQKDRAFGSNKIKLINEEISALEDLADAQKVYLNEIEEKLKSDQLNVEKYGAIIQDGRIINYDEIFQAELDKYNTAVSNYNKTGNETKFEASEKRYEDFKKALSLYEETSDLFESETDKLNDFINEIQDKNYEKLEYELELKVEINEADLKRLDFSLEKYSDDFYKMAESAALMLSQGENYVKGLQNYAVLDSEGNLIDGHAAQLKQDYEDGKISQEAYINGMKNVRDGIYNQLEALDELDKKMRHYYEDTLSAANEELSDYIDHMEHLNSVFDHYINLMDILGKSKDYEAIGNFLSGKAQTSRDRLDVAQSNLDMLEGQKASIKESLDAAIASGDEEAIDYWTDQWDYIVDATDAAQEEVLSLTEQWASDMKAVIQNNLNKLADDLEKSLTEGMGFERLMDNFDKLNERQEEYLTKTNQVYETNKLMRQANKALDETDNKVAKQKLKNFIDETKNLQQNTKLSKYELEIQQAKYDLLLAEIALEEAKNAKSTVRLSRDSEGNFGYVYTADQDKIDEAQQAYDDADNRLYNISLEGQQKYTEKYLQAQQDMYNELAELQEAYLNGEIETEEEYKARQQEIMDHYYGENGVLTTYANLYNVAVRTDADATADNWQKNYGDMTQDTEKWKDNVNDYLKEVEKEFDTWEEVAKQANEDVGGALENSKKATEELTDESKELKDTIVDDVIPAIEEQLDAVKLQIEAYDELRESIEAMTKAYEKYLETLDQDIEEASTTPAYDKDTDYTALAIGYLRTGGSPEDPEFKRIMEQRDAKIIGEGLNYQTGDEAVATIIEEANSSKKIGEKYKDKEFIDSELDRLKITSFATGGYTGDWGPYGKLAILHQKELVLNEYDTKNLLNTISMIKDIVGMIDSQAQLAALSNLHASFGADMLNQKLEQMVTIHAEFPNATEHNEIEEAFNNLINKATQYANRK